jgi:hypothetical protein
LGEAEKFKRYLMATRGLAYLEFGKGLACSGVCRRRRTRRKLRHDIISEICSASTYR